MFFLLAERYNCPENGESATSFLNRVIANDDLALGNIEILNNVFMGLEEDPAVVALQKEEERLAREEYEKTLPPICDFKQSIIRNCRVVKKKNKLLIPKLLRGIF
jgi:hypothetical protein